MNKVSYTAPEMETMLIANDSAICQTSGGNESFGTIPGVGWDL